MHRKLIRVDGSSAIGLGHIIRCVALAQIISKKYFVTFFCKEIPSDILAGITQMGFEVITIQAEEDFFQNIGPGDTVIIDGYHFTTDYEQTVKSRCLQLITIDDLFDRHYVADAIINHGLGIDTANYSKESYTKVYTGADYMLMRENFYDATLLERPITAVRNLYINMGGSDPGNVTEAIVQCIDAARFESIHIVVGAASSNLEAILNVIKSRNLQNINVHYNLDQYKMQNVMQQCELAICTPSGVAYELCCVGCGLVVCKTASNQKYFFKEFIQRGLAFGIDTLCENFVDALLRQCYKCIDEVNTVKDQISVQRKYFHANAKENVLNILAG